GAGPIWLDDVNCTGTEVALSLCRYREWGHHNCHHGEDVGVVCAGTIPSAEQPQVRLVNGSTPCLGRVEVFHEHKWGTICDDTWDLADAQVICRQLGCGYALGAPGSARFGRGPDPIWLDGTHCTGREERLDQCELHAWGQHDCSHGEDVGVVCSGNTDVSSPPGANPLQVRLRDGPGPCSGQ
ncbi:DMBT1 protein, partial [Serilophus lunatus]|nr:DMBT1 protein [Serilophus lunatus]